MPTFKVECYIGKISDSLRILYRFLNSIRSLIPVGRAEMQREYAALPSGWTITFANRKFHSAQLITVLEIERRPSLTNIANPQNAICPDSRSSEMFMPLILPFRSRTHMNDASFIAIDGTNGEVLILEQITRLEEILVIVTQVIKSKCTAFEIEGILGIGTHRIGIFLPAVITEPLLEDQGRRHLQRTRFMQMNKVFPRILITRFILISIIEF